MGVGSKIANLIQKLLCQICVLQHLSDVRVRLAKIKYRMTEWIERLALSRTSSEEWDR